jgi:hypothetical protein
MKTGTAPFWMIGATVVGNPAQAVMTSSPGRMRRSPSWCEVKAEKATRFAELPLLTRTLWRTPMKEDSSRSNASPSGPRVSQKSSMLETPATTSSSS